MTESKNLYKNGFDAYVLNINPSIVYPPWIFDMSERSYAPEEYLPDTTCSLTCFKSHIKSSLSQEEHLAVLRVCKALQEHGEPAADDLKIWANCSTRRIAEKEKVQQMAKLCSAVSKKHIIRLYKVYLTYFVFTMQQWLQKEPENVHLYYFRAIPSINHNSAAMTQKFDVTNVQLLLRKGHLLIDDGKFHENVQSVLSELEELQEMYKQALPAKQAALDEFQRERDALVQEQATAAEEAVCFIIPFETLLFLLTSHDCIDLPRKVLFHIKQTSAERKLIEFEQPLPANNTAWHCWTQGAEMILTAHLSMRADWLNVHNNEVTPSPMPETQESVGTSQRALELKHNRALLKWQLSSCVNEPNEKLQVFTDLELPLALSKNNEQFVQGHNIKMEYRTIFGCQQKTKYELFKELLQLHFLQAINATNNLDSAMIYTSRLSAKSFNLMLMEESNMKDIKLQLEQLTPAVDFSLVLQRLYNMLTYLTAMQQGKYLIVADPDRPNTLGIFARAQEETKQTRKLHDYFNAVPEMFEILFSDAYLPISDRLVGAMHEHNEIAPCMLPWKKSQLFPSLKDERSSRLERNYKQREQKATDKAKKRKQRKRYKQKQRKKIMRAAKAQEKLDNEMDYDFFTTLLDF